MVDDSGVSLLFDIPSSRITPPSLSPEFMERTALLQQIENSGNQITYISAPTGFGKTTLASQWVKRGSGHQVWMVGNRFDSENYFLIAATKAFQSAIPDFAPWFNEKFIKAGFDLRQTTEKLMVEVNKIKKEIRFVLDDSNALGVSDNEVAAAFTKAMPENCYLLIIREELPQVITMKALGVDEITTITSDQLLLKPDEIKTLLGSTTQMHEQFSDEIFNATGGWPAAVHLMLEEIKSQSGKNANNFSHAGNLDQLSLTPVKIYSKKALSRLTQEEIDLIKSLVFVEKISNEVALKISGNPKSAFMLAKLAIGSFYLNRISTNPPIYEINSLIKSALHEELAEDPNRYAEIHHASFEALFHFGPKYRALELLSKSGNVQLLEELFKDDSIQADLSVQIRNSVYSSAIDELRMWGNYFPYLPAPLRSLDFALKFYRLFISGEYKEANALLIKKAAELNQNDPLQDDVTRLLVASEFSLGNFISAVEKTLKLIDRSKRGEAFFNSYSSFLRFGMISAFLSEDHKSMKKIEEYITSNPPENYFGHFQFNSLCIQGLLAFFEGRYRVAEPLAYAALSYAQEHNIQGAFAPFEACFIIFQIAIENGQRDEALDKFSKAEINLKEHPLVPWLIVFNCRLAIMYGRFGDREKSVTYFSKARNFFDKYQFSSELALTLDRHEIYVQHFFDGDRRRDVILDRLPNSQIHRMYTAHQHLRGNDAEFQKAIARFDMNLPREALNAYVFQVIHNFDYPPKARDFLKNALELASEHGFYEYLLIQGDRFLTFLVASVSEMPSIFLEKLAREASERLRNKLTSPESLPDPLTRREADILRHLSSDKPIATIASDLNISKNTIKTHLRHLYKKLGATDRHDAVARGKALLSM